MCRPSPELVRARERRETRTTEERQDAFARAVTVACTVLGVLFLGAGLLLD